MKFTSSPVLRNSIVAVLACVVSYLILTGAFLIEGNFTGWGKVIQEASEGRLPEDTVRSIDVFSAARGWLIRMRYVYIPLALLLPAFGITRASSGWRWSWLVTLIACLPGLIVLAITTGENMGFGILVALCVYFVIAGAVTWSRYNHGEDVPI